MMMDYTEAREKMVDCQVRTCDVTDHDLISAMLDVPRQVFLPEELSELAYIDDDISLKGFGSEGRYLMAPAKIGQLIQAAKPGRDDVVLVVGSGAGYTAAILSKLVSSVVAVEVDGALVETSTKALSENGFDNVAVLRSDLADGFFKEAPYDLIFIEGSVDEVPESLFEQLGENGQLVTVVGHGNAGESIIFKKIGDVISRTRIMNCSAKPLPGFEKAAEFSL